MSKKAFLVVVSLLAIGQACFVQAAQVLFPHDTQWRYFKALSAPSTPQDAWRQFNFNDSGWLTSQAPFFYENDTGYSGNTDLIDMSGSYSGIFMRKSFSVANPADILQLTLDVVTDDGCIVWINGVEVARVNMPAGEVPFNGTSSPAAGEPNLLTTTIANTSMLLPGNNVLAVQAMNSGLGNSSDFLISVSLSADIDNQPPIIESINPPPTATVRSLFQVEIVFSEAVTNVDAGDLLINNVPATQVEFGIPGQVTWIFDEPMVGPVEARFAANHGITDQASTPNAFVATMWNYTLDPNAEPPGVIISEFMASNDDTINDEDGDSSDWIEIVNPGSVAANLAGWYLTHDPDNLMEWRIPSIGLLPNELLLVFASGKDRTNVAGRLHTNFLLAREGGYLALVDPEGNVVSEFNLYPEQEEDVSYGRDRANPNVVAYFTNPTPGTPNTVGGPGFAPEIIFSRKSGTFSEAFSLELRTAPPGAQIRYTTLDAIPTEASTLYTGPIPVTETTMIRARAFQAGLLPGMPRSEHFIRLSGTEGVNSDLPLMILHNYGRGAVPTSGEQPVIMQIFEPKLGRSSLTNAPDLSTRGRFRLRGSSTQGTAKQSFAYESWDEFNQDVDIAPIGLPAESDWVLYAPNNFEPALIHNPLAYRLSREIGRYATRTRFVELYLKDDGGGSPGAVLAGDYNGVYVLIERIKVDNDRVDIDRLQPENLTPPSVTGGYLHKVDRVDPGDSGFVAAGQTILYVDPKEPEIELPQRDAQQQYIINYFTQFGTALNGANYRDPVLGYPRFMDIPAAIDHHIHNVVTFNVDALRLSGFFYKPRDTVNDLGQAVPGKITFGPVWDFDRTQGSTDSRDFNPRTFRSRIPDLGTDFFNYPWWGRMFTDPNFWQAWIDRYQQLRLNEFSTNNVFRIIDELANEVREAQVRNRARWPTVGGNPRNGALTTDGYSFNFNGTYQGEIDFKKAWYRDRFNYIDGQFLAMPQLTHGGGQVAAGTVISLAGPVGATIYYTLDGTDPRASGGDVVAGAFTYSGSITINANARLVARARNLSHMNVTGANNPPISSPWSGPVSATYVVQTPRLVITEIMYHPRGAGAGNTNDAETFEWIELQNVGSTTLNLIGIQFTNGIEFKFTASSAVTNLQPGQYVVLVKNPTEFTALYGANSRVAGQYSGGLANAGERLALVGRFLEPILDFSYDDDWYPVTDGSGFSLVIKNPNAALSTWGTKASWRISGIVQGTPGADDPGESAFPRVIINEVLTHTDLPQVDAIELRNLESQPVNIGGWFLTDDFTSPAKYTIPTDTIVPGNGYLVIYETNFNANPGLPGNFALSSTGDEVYLYSGDGLDVSGYAHGFEFEAAPNGQTFGRHVLSTSAEELPLEIMPSLGLANSGPRIGPVILSEVMYHPPDFVGGFDNEQDEFIELFNMSGSSAPLFDPNHMTNTWRLRDAVDFDFPPGITLGLGERILVVGFDPANTAALDAFRARNNVGAGVRVFGPWEGKLDNSSDEIELQRPDAPQLPPNEDIIPYYFVERVRYFDVSPWPVAGDGIGPSLHRLETGGYGNDPVNWVSAARTPGAAYGGGSPPTISQHPQPRTVIASETATFTVVAGGPEPRSYQWRFNGSPIPGATNATLTLENVQASQAGEYQAIVLNPANAVASSSAILTVLIPATISLQPQSQSVPPGVDVSFTVIATSTTPITYQWFKNNVPILGATSVTLNLLSVDPSDDAVYHVALTDGVGTLRSQSARLAVLIRPDIVVAPIAQTNFVGSTVTFSVQITNTATLPIGYRWRKGGASVSSRVLNTRTDFFSLTGIQLADVANYSVVVTNQASYTPGLVSPLARLTVIAIMDMDGDGLPDAYENSNGLGANNPNDADLDADTDGFTNRQEYQAGTDPQDPQSYLQVESIGALNGAVIRFRAVNSKTYSIQYREAFGDAGWQSVAGVPAISAVSTDSRMVEVIDDKAPVGGNRFYRLVTPGL